MSLPGSTPLYVLAYRRPDGLIDYKLMNPSGWGQDRVVHIAPCAARDEEQAIGRIQNLLPAWQKNVEFVYCDKPLA